MIQNPSEHSIVRTLNLELFSNLEDSMLKEKLNPSLKQEIEKIKNLVKIYFEERALYNYGCYNSFLSLLKEVEITCQNELDLKSIIHPILLKHKEIVENRRPNIKLQRPSHSYLLRSAIYLDLLKPNISEIRELSKRLHLPLLPKLPKPTRIFNLYAWIDNINLLHSSYRPAGIWLFKHMKIFTFKDLCLSLKKSCNLIAEKLTNIGEYQIATIDKKSQVWVAEVGYRFLPFDNPPSQVLKLEDNIISSDLFDPIFKSTCENFIFFDDCAYTGSQFMRMISELYYKLSANKYSESNNFPSYKTKRIFFIYGASAIDLNEMVKKYNFNQHNVFIECISSYKVNNIKTLLEQEALPEKLINKIKKLVSGNKNSECKQTPLTTEWKTPDAVSIPAFYLGRIPYNCSRVRTESRKRKPHNPEIAVSDIYKLMDVTRFSDFPPITDIEKPY